MIQHTIAVFRDAFLDNNQAAIVALGSELATPIKATTVEIDHCGVFAKFKYEEHTFKLRYIETEHSFWMAEFLTTQNFYEIVTGKNPSYFKDSNLPVESVTYDEAIEFCNKLNQYFQIPKMDFDLPSEKEWLAAKPYEYKDIELNKDEDLQKIAWYNQNSNNSTRPVGQKQSNVNGLYDLLSNVWEWTITDYGAASEMDKRKVVLGSSWILPADYLQCSLHCYVHSTINNFMYIGFRVILRHDSFGI